MTEPGVPAPATDRVPLRGTRLALYVVFAGFVASIVVAVSALMLHVQAVRFSVLVGFVLLFFGLFKIGIALDAVTAPPAVAPESDRRQETGSPGVFRLWVGYKLTPAALAIVAASYLFVVGSAAIDALVTAR
jgi:hypothetical protein